MLRSGVDWGWGLGWYYKTTDQRREGKSINTIRARIEEPPAVIGFEIIV